MFDGGNFWDYAIIILYLVVVVGIGFYFNSDTATTENYLLGGRNMPWLAIGLSCIMSLLSSISIVVVPGEIYNNGFTLYMFHPTLITWLAIPCYLLFVRFYFKLGSFTPYEYLEFRYDRSVRGVVALSAFYSRVFYIGMVLYTTAKIFESAYGWEAWVTILLVGVIGVFYTVLGGMKAVVWSDVLQFFVLAGGLIFTLIVLCTSIDGGAVEAVRYAIDHGHGIPQLRDPDFYKITPYVRLLFFLLLWNAITSPLSSACSDQINIQRLLSTKDWKAGFKAQITGTVIGFFTMQIIYFIGFAIFTYYHQHPDPMLEKLGGDAAFFRFVSTKLPTPVPGIFMAAMLAAIMSTLDSGINSMATVWLKEFHSKFINKHMSNADEVRVSRMATLFIGIFGISLGLAVNFSGRWLSQSVAEVGTIFGILGAATLPAFLFAVLTPRANSTLIWAYTFYGLGEVIAKNCWYVLSRTSEQAWYRNPTLPFGWADKLSAGYLIVPVVCGVAMCAPYLVRGLRRSKWVKLLALLGMTWFGCAGAFALWYYFSQDIHDVPLARSFAFHLPLSLIGAFIIVWFCPKQPERKYRGLTLSTLGEPVAALADK